MTQDDLSDSRLTRNVERVFTDAAHAKLVCMLIRSAYESGFSNALFACETSGMPRTANAVHETRLIADKAVARYFASSGLDNNKLN